MKHPIALFLSLMFVGASHYANAQDSLSGDQATEYEEEEDNADHQILDPKDLSTTQEYNADKIIVRKFEDDKWKKVIGSTDYDETHTNRKKIGADQGSGGSRNGKRYRGNDQDDDDEEDDASEGFSFSIGPFGGLLLQVIFYGAVILVIGLILYNVIKNTSLKRRVRRNTEGLPEFTTHVEDISDLNIDEMLERALASGNYRLTIRIYFLGLLKKLNEGGFIVWKKDKTNRDYLTELYSKSEYFTEVRKLTLAYEQVWYGDHSLSSGLFQELSDEFKSIDQKLNTAKIS